MNRLPEPPTDEEPIARNVVALVKGEERYIVVYGDGREDDALCTLGRWASVPDLSFSWYDAAEMSQRIRRDADLNCEGK